MASNYSESSVDAEDAGKVLLEVVHTLQAFRTAGKHRGKHSISGTKVGVLHCLSREDARLSEIAQRLSISMSVASRAVDSLEDSGLVERRRDPTDGRALEVILTEKGRIDLAQRHAYIAEKFVSVLTDWTQSDIEQTLAVLQRLNIGLDQLTDELKNDEREAFNA